MAQLPLRKWTIQDYKEWLEELIKENVIKDYKSHCTDTIISFIVSLNPEDASKSDDELMEKFKLRTSLATTNMVRHSRSHSFSRDCQHFLLPILCRVA